MFKPETYLLKIPQFGTVKMSSKKNALHICHIIHDIMEIEKCSQVIENISSTNHNDAQHTLIILKPLNGLNISLPSHVSCLELNLKKIFNIRSLFIYKKALKAINPNICQSYGDKAAIMLWIAKRNQIPLTLHSTLLHANSSLPNWMRNIYFRFLRSSIDFFTVSSAKESSWLSSKIAVKPEKIKLIRPAINARQHSPSLHQVPYNHSYFIFDNIMIPNRKYIFAFSIEKLDKETVFSFIDDYARAKKLSITLFRHSYLLILGNNKYLSDLRHYVEQKITTEDVCFTGFINDHYRLFSRVDIFVHLEQIDKPSIVLLEAMAMSLPIISPRCEKTIQDNLNPFNWELENGQTQIQEQLIELVNNDKKRLALGRASREYVSKYHCIQKHHHIIKKLYNRVNHISSNKLTFNTLRE